MVLRARALRAEALSLPTGFLQHHILSSARVSLPDRPPPFDCISAEMDCPLLPGITATSKVTSTVSDPLCPKVPFSFRYVLSMPFFCLELGTDYLRRHGSILLSFNIHHLRQLSCLPTSPGPLHPFIHTLITWPPLNSPNSAHWLSLHTSVIVYCWNCFNICHCTSESYPF